MAVERPFLVDIDSVDYMVLALQVGSTHDSIAAAYFLVVPYFLVVDNFVDSLAVGPFADAVAVT